MLQAFLHRRLGEGVVIRTAGVLPGERPVDEHTLAVLKTFGVDARGHVSVHLERDAVQAADLILCLERRHLREVLVLDRQAFGRAFTVRELVRRGEATGQRAGGESLAHWLARLHEGREAAQVVADAPGDDIADPTGGPRAGYEQTATWLDALAIRLVGLAWPPDADRVAPDADDGEEVDSRASRALAAVAEDAAPELELWRGRGKGGHPELVGLLADRAGVRLARGVESTLEVLGYGLSDLANDAWVATTWSSCTAEAAGALADGRLDVGVILTESATGPAALANRTAGVRAVAPVDVTSARRARRQWGANLLCLGVDEVTPAQAVDILHAFLREAPVVAPELDDGQALGPGTTRG
jgi:ribose 5-phosphate isomerase RpiB/protein-tyrosine-phosphatase